MKLAVMFLFISLFYIVSYFKFKHLNQIFCIDNFALFSVIHNGQNLTITTNISD